MKNVSDAFVEQALATETDQCILYPYGTSAGYAWGRSKYLHRIICERVYGPCPLPDLETAHSCGMRRCLNKRHLRWATQEANMADRLIHGTHNRGRGGAKLTKEQVLEIRAKYRTIKNIDLAKEYGVTDATICDIAKRRSWAWL